MPRTSSLVGVGLGDLDQFGQDAAASTRVEERHPPARVQAGPGRLVDQPVTS